MQRYLCCLRNPASRSSVAQLRSGWCADTLLGRVTHIARTARVCSLCQAPMPDAVHLFVCPALKDIRVQWTRTVYPLLPPSTCAALLNTDRVAEACLGFTRHYPLLLFYAATLSHRLLSRWRELTATPALF